jgi:hypothetical protein
MNATEQGSKGDACAGALFGRPMSDCQAQVPRRLIRNLQRSEP